MRQHTRGERPKEGSRDRDGAKSGVEGRERHWKADGAEHADVRDEIEPLRIRIVIIRIGGPY